MIRIRLLWVACSAFLLLWFPCRSGAAQDRPSFLVIVADDLGWADVGWHGSEIPTPHLDRLAKEGVRLEQHYVAPMCSPTRAALLSGRYWSRFGLTGATNERVFRFDQVTLANALKEQGYATLLTGKWHLGSLPEWGADLFGFDHWHGSMAGGLGPWNHFYKRGPYIETWHRNGTRLTEEGHVTDLFADEAIRWMKQRGEEPFLLYVPFTAPHIPIREEQKWLDRVAHIEEPGYRHFAACVTHMDDAVGRMIAALEETGRRDETLVLFFSDNGGNPDARNNDPKYPPDNYPELACGGRNTPLRGKKGQIYEGGIRVPAFVHWPKRLEPGVFNPPVHVVDWMPTLCALADFKPQYDLRWDGINLWPQITGKAEPEPRRLYWAGVRHRTAAVREGDWKLIAHRGNNPRFELFDLQNDPNESNDLSSKHPDKVETLKSLLKQLAARDRDAAATD